RLSRSRCRAARTAAPSRTSLRRPTARLPSANASSCPKPSQSSEWQTQLTPRSSPLGRRRCSSTRRAARGARRQWRHVEASCLEYAHTRSHAGHSETTPLYGSAVDFAVLGPLRCTDGVEDVTPRRRREAALLCALLVEPGAPVAAETLAAAVWHGAPPESWSK